MMRAIRRCALASALVLTACGSDSRTPPAVPAGDAAVTWKRVGSWSGRGDGQTTTFLVERHEWRLSWEAESTLAGEDLSRMTVRVHSGDSGRILDVPLDGVAAGRGVVELIQEPRVFYLSVEADTLQWRLTADERIEVRARALSPRDGG